MKGKNIKDMILSSVFAAVMCIFSVITVPVGAVPISMGIFALVLTACVLKPKQAVSAAAVYILIGIVGLPVFSGFRSGISVIAGPTGGYVLAYIPTAMLISCLASRYAKSVCAVIKLSAVSFLGVLVCYMAGTLQYMLITHVGAVEALLVCVVPFAVFDLLKCIAGAYLAYRIRRILKI